MQPRRYSSRSFEREVIDRLARIETETAGVKEQLARMNGAVAAHARELEEHKSRLDRAHGVAAALAAILGTLAAGVVQGATWLFGRSR